MINMTLKWSWQKRLEEWPEHALAKSDLLLRPNLIDTRLTGDFLAIPLDTGRFYIFKSSFGRDQFVSFYKGFNAQALETVDLDKGGI